MAPKSNFTDITTDSAFLRAARGKTLLGRSGFAKLIGTSTWYVRDVERGRYELSPRTRRIVESLAYRNSDSLITKNFRYGTEDGDYLKRSRQILGLSQRQFARSCGVSASVIQNIEARRSLIPRALRRTIKEVLLLGDF